MPAECSACLPEMMWLPLPSRSRCKSRALVSICQVSITAQNPARERPPLTSTEECAAQCTHTVMSVVRRRENTQVCANQTSVPKREHGTPRHSAPDCVWWSRSLFRSRCACEARWLSIPAREQSRQKQGTRWWGRFKTNAGSCLLTSPTQTASQTPSCSPVAVASSCKPLQGSSCELVPHAASTLGAGTHKITPYVGQVRHQQVCFKARRLYSCVLIQVLRGTRWPCSALDAAGLGRTEEAGTWGQA